MLGPLGKRIGKTILATFTGVGLVEGTMECMRFRTVRKLKQRRQSEEYLMMTKLVETVSAQAKYLEKLMQSVEFLEQKAESESHSQNAGKAPV